MSFSQSLLKGFGICLLSSVIVAQQPVASTELTTLAVPRLVNFSGKVSDVQGKPVAGVSGVTFAIYKDQYEGAPLWVETQNVTADAKGSYTVQLGATRAAGLPLDLFTSGEARWLGVQVSGQAEQPRVLLLSVPYALKAADAETIGGLPPSAFVLAAPAAVNAGSGASPGLVASTLAAPPASSDVTTTGGTANSLPLFTTATNVQNSAVTQTGSGATAKIGINTTAPTTTLDIHGGAAVRGTFVLPATGVAVATAGKASQPQQFVASSFSSASSAALNQTFQWEAEPANNNTANPSATLNLLYGLGTAKPAETGLRIGPKGIIAFAPGQTFPGGSGNGSVSSVALSAPASDFTVSGSPITSSGTLALAWNVPPTNTNTANAIVKRDASGGFIAGAAILYAPSGYNAVQGVTDTAVGVVGESSSGFGGEFISTSNTGLSSSSQTYHGIDASSGISDAVVGVCCTEGTPAGFGVYGSSPGGSGGVWGESHYGGGEGLLGTNDSYGGDGLLSVATSPAALAAFFDGNVEVDGYLSKSSGSFKIDHPLDPANKYLYHSFVESPDMMNVYNGNALLDSNGEAVIELPNWFESLNRDFRYQLTSIGAPAVLYVAEEIAGNKFKISGGRPGGKVSWQVTGIRQDAWANAHRIPVEEEKPEGQRGFYLHPDLFGAPEEKRIVWARHPGTMQRVKHAEAAQKRSVDAIAAKNQSHTVQP